MIDITAGLEFLITVALLVVARFLVPAIKNRMEKDEYELLKAVVTAGVKAAEKKFKESGMGAQKKAYVLDYLESKGYTVDTEDIENLLEAAVKDLD